MRLVVCVFLVSGTACSSDAETTTCGSGTQKVGGKCVVSAVTCEEGTRLEDGHCVPDLASVCGPGTEPAADGSCTPIENLVCGPGTIRQDTGSGVFACLPLCVDGQIWNQVSETCVDQCGPGTLLDGVTQTCLARCSDDQYYVSAADNCVHVPECLRNAFFDEGGGDCAGWPWNELNLETVCARQAFNICDPIFDPACGCDNGGEVGFFARPGDGVHLIYDLWNERIASRNPWDPSLPEIERLADHVTCVVETYSYCEEFGHIAELRNLEALGEVVVDSVKLAQLDANFVVAEGTCTRAVGWDAWPEDLFRGLAEGNRTLDEECVGDMSCSADAFCAPVPDHVHTPDDPQPYTCQPRVAAAETCEPLAHWQCQSGLLCLPDNSFTTWTCQPPRLEGTLCDDHFWCVEGLICRPENLSAALRDLQVPNDPTCQPPLGTGAACPGPLFDWGPSGGSYPGYAPFDFCDDNDFCDLAAVPAGTTRGHVGTCLAASGVDDSCDWCQERAFHPFVYDLTGAPQTNMFIDMWMFPSLEGEFSSCAGGLTCGQGGTGPAWVGVCSDAISVCPLSFDNVYGYGSFCGEICDPMNPMDEDHDGYFDCDDEDCCYSFAADCFQDDTRGGHEGNILGQGACGEYSWDACHNNYDDDGDGLIDCGDDTADPPIQPDFDCVDNGHCD